MWYELATKKWLTLNQISKIFPNTSIPEDPTPGAFDSKGIVWVEPDEKPTLTSDQIATPSEIAEVRDGKWYRPWVIGDKFETQAEKNTYLSEQIKLSKSDIRTKVDKKRTQLLETGFTYNFQDGTPGVVEIRKENDDKANIMGIVLSGLNLVQAGNFAPTDDEKPFYIDQADVKHLLTGPEAVAFGQAVFDWVGKIYDAANQHKKTFETNNPATGEAWTAEEIRDYDFSGGWEV